MSLLFPLCSSLTDNNLFSIMKSQKTRKNTPKQIMFIFLFFCFCFSNSKFSHRVDTFHSYIKTRRCFSLSGQTLVMFFRHRSRCESNVFTIITQAAIKHSEMHKHIFDIDLNYLTMKQEKKKSLASKSLGYQRRNQSITITSP